MTSSGEMGAKELLTQHGGILSDYGKHVRQAQKVHEASSAIDDLNNCIDLNTHRFSTQVSGNLVYLQDDVGAIRQQGTVTATAGWKFVGDKLVPMRINPEVRLPHSLEYLGETAMTLALLDSEQGVGVSINQSLLMPTLGQVYAFGWNHQSNQLAEQARQMGLGDNIYFDNSPF